MASLSHAPSSRAGKRSPQVRLTLFDVREAIDLLDELEIHIKSAIESTLYPDGTFDPIDRQNVFCDRRDLRRLRGLRNRLKASAAKSRATTT